jgi:hypothetical protein
MYHPIAVVVQTPEKVETRPLMGVYHPEPLRPEKPARHYRAIGPADAAELDDAVQAAYGG